MEKWMKRFLLGVSTAIVACSTLIYGGSMILGDAAQAQMSKAGLPQQCIDDPELDWRCVVISRDEPGIASQTFEDNCVLPSMLAPFDIDEKGRVVTYVMVGRVIEDCVVGGA